MLTSYHNSIFNPEEIYFDIQEMVTQQQNTPRGETAGEHKITSAEIDIEIDRLRDATHLESPHT